MSFAVRDLSNDIESIELKPLSEITAVRVPHKEIPCLFQEQFRGVIHKRFILDQSRHGKGRVHASTKSSVEIIICRTEERLQTMTFGNGLLDDIEVRLFTGESESGLKER